MGSKPHKRLLAYIDRAQPPTPGVQATDATRGDANDPPSRFLFAIWKRFVREKDTVEGCREWLARRDDFRTSPVYSDRSLSKREAALLRSPGRRAIFLANGFARFARPPTPARGLRYSAVSFRFNDPPFCSLVEFDRPKGDRAPRAARRKGDEVG